jgi:hypothetical protein
MIPGKIHASTAGKSIIDNKMRWEPLNKLCHSANMVLIHKVYRVTTCVRALWGRP